MNEIKDHQQSIKQIIPIDAHISPNSVVLVMIGHVNPHLGIASYFVTINAENWLANYWHMSIVGISNIPSSDWLLMAA